MDKDQLKTRKLELRDILVAHDVERFKLFLKENQFFFPDLKDKVLDKFSDGELNELMHVMKAGQVHFGPEWQKSRNYFRLKTLEQRIVDMPARVSGALLDFEAENDSWPLCSGCEYFRKPAPGEIAACMHRGSSPNDVACIGWDPGSELSQKSS